MERPPVFYRTFHFLTNGVGSYPVFKEDGIDDPRRSLIGLSREDRVCRIKDFARSRVVGLLPMRVVRRRPSVLAGTFPRIQDFTHHKFEVVPANVVLMVAICPVQGDLLSANTPVIQGMGRIVFVFCANGVHVSDEGLLVKVLGGGLEWDFRLVGIIVSVCVVGFIHFVLGTRNRVRRRLSFFVVVNRFEDPDTACLAMDDEWFIGTRVDALPIGRVPEFRRCRPPIIAPSMLFSVTFPFYVAVSIALHVGVRVNRQRVRYSVQAARSVQVTSAFLFDCHVSNCSKLSFIRNNGDMTIKASYRIGSVILIFIRSRRVNTRVFLSQGYVPVARTTRAQASFSDKGRAGARDVGAAVVVIVRKKGVRVANGSDPFFPIFARLSKRAIATVIRSNGRVFPGAVKGFHLILHVPMGVRSLSVKGSSNVDLFVVVRSGPNRVSVPYPSFRLYFMVFIFDNNRRRPSINEDPAFNLRPWSVLLRDRKFKDVFFPGDPLGSRLEAFRVVKRFRSVFSFLLQDSENDNECNAVPTIFHPFCQFGRNKTSWYVVTVNVYVVGGPPITIRVVCRHTITFEPPAVHYAVYVRGKVME